MTRSIIVDRTHQVLVSGNLLLQKMNELNPPTLVSATEKTSGIGETELGVSVADVEFDPSLEFASTEFLFGVEPKLGQISEM